MQRIHETVVRDIVDLASDVKDSDEVKSFLNRKNGNASFKSITSRAEALTMVFPAICSKNMDYSTAAMICKATERKAVTLLQMLFSAANITDASNGIDYISRFHTNLRAGSFSVDEFLDVMDDFVEENALLTESAEVEEYNRLKEDMKSMNFYFENSVNEQSIGDYSVVTLKDGSKLFVNEAPNFPRSRDVTDNLVFARFHQGNDGRFNPTGEYITRNMNMVGPQPNTMNPIQPGVYVGPGANGNTTGSNDPDIGNLLRGNNNTATDIYNMQSDEFKNALAAQRYDHDVEMDQIRNAQKDRELGMKARDLDLKAQKQAQDIMNIQANIMKNRLVDNDVKKANELVPTLMYVNFISKDDNSNYPIATSMVVGVKAKLYAVDGADIMNRLRIKKNDKNLLLNLVKVSTREISFFRDFLFAIDKAKIDALSQSRRGSSSKLWKVLERRALRSKLRRFLSLKNDATAITTLCVTQDEVEFLKKTEYFDLENPKIIRAIMDAYNLMGFIIADESLEIAKFIYDTGDDIYETITFDNLEKEQRDNSKKIINLMSKMNR